MTNNDRLLELRRQRDFLRGPEFRTSMQARRNVLSLIVPLLNFNEGYYFNAVPIADVLGRPGFSVTSTITTSSQHAYEVRPCKDHGGVELISDALPFGGLWCGESNAISNAIDYAQFFSRSHSAVIRVYHATDNGIEMHEHTADLKEALVKDADQAAAR